MIFKGIEIKYRQGAFITLNGKNIKAQDVLFFDIETKPEYDKLSEATDNVKDLWANKADVLRKFSKNHREDMDDSEIYTESAALFAEYQRIVCVSLGTVDDNGKINTISLVGEHIDEKIREKWIIEQCFALILVKNKTYYCGANINPFDIPSLMKRGFKYGLMIPQLITKFDSKPWDANKIDLTTFWKGASNLRDARIQTIAHTLGIESPKDEMDGSMVAQKYIDGDFEAIATYCEKDVITCIKIFLHLQNLLIPERA